jgi:hypothetical protein
VTTAYLGHSIELATEGLGSKYCYWGVRENRGWELARGCKGVFIVAFDERGSTSPRVGMGDVSGVLIVIESADIVPISTWREEGRELCLEEMLERGMLEICGTLKGNTW